MNDLSIMTCDELVSQITASTRSKSSSYLLFSVVFFGLVPLPVPGILATTKVVSRSDLYSARAPDRSQALTLTLALKQQKTEELLELFHKVSDPRDANYYGKYLSLD